MSIKPSSECPTYFRACVYESQRAREGYARAGYQLGIHLEQLAEPEALDIPEAAAHQADPTGAVWRWIGDALPRCRALVPTRRRDTFVRGLLAGAARENVVSGDWEC